MVDNSLNLMFLFAVLFFCSCLTKVNQTTTRIDNPPDSSEGNIYFINNEDSLIGDWQIRNDTLLFSKNACANIPLFIFNMQVGERFDYLGILCDEKFELTIELKDKIFSLNDTIFVFKHDCGSGIRYNEIAKQGVHSPNLNNTGCDTREYKIKKPFTILEYTNFNINSLNACNYFANKIKNVSTEMIIWRMENLYGYDLPTLPKSLKKD